MISVTLWITAKENIESICLSPTKLQASASAMAAAQTTTIARAYPKRKRAAVSYCESDLDEGEGDESDVSIDEGLPRKVCWIFMAR